MSTTISPPVRILGLVGILAAAALGLLLFTQNRSSSHDSTAAPAAVTPHTQPATKPATKPQVHATKPVKAVPKIVLLPGLPAPITKALRRSKVVVVSLYAAGTPGDAAARQQARAGAKASHAGFAAVNVLDERNALQLDLFVGTTSSPVVIVVRRPGRIVNRFDGYTDSQLVAQAAQNAGAGR